MKNTFKRIAAFAVMLCMLLSVVPAVAFAEETESPAQLDTITYDFDQRAQEFTYTSGDNTSTVTLAGQNLWEVSNKGAAAREKIAELYLAGTIGWKYHSAGNIFSEATTFSVGFGADDVNYILTLRNGSHTAGSYFAMTIKSPGTGDYKLTLDYFTHNTGASQASVYVLPASVTDIVGALEYYEALGTFSCYSTVSSGTSLGTGTETFGNTVSMKAGKEYILVFTNDALSSSRTDRASLYLGNVTLDLQAPAQDLDTISYDFAAARTEFAGTTADVKLTGTSDTDAVINARYVEGIQDWKFHSTGNTTGGTAAAVNFNLNKSVVYGAQLVTAGYLNKAYYAVTVRSPGSGDYALTLNYWTHSTGASKGSVYILPSNTTDVAAAIDAATAVGSFDSDSGVASFTSVSTLTMENVVSMEAGAEYLLVFTADEYAARGDRATLYIDGVTMNRIVSLDEITYDFDQRAQEYEYTSGDNTSTTTLAGKNMAATSGNSNAAGRTHLAGLYTAETIYWNYHSAGNLADGTAASFGFGFGADSVNYSLVLTAPTSTSSVHSADAYFATTIRSPGYGDYTLTLDYFTHSTGASQASIYILPADTADIAAAIAATTAVGTFSCEGEFTSNSVLGEGTATYDVSLGMAEKYLLVFTNDALSSVNTNRASLYLGGVKLTNKAASGTEEEVGDFIADGVNYATFAEAVPAAFDSDMTVKLNADVAMDELTIPAGISVDLNGKTLTVTEFVGIMGDVADSSAGNAGVLKASGAFNPDNADVPLYDAAAEGYRFFDYLLEVHSEAEAVGTSSQKFWFKFHFYTDDTCTELDQDAYALVAAGDSGFEISTQMSWNGEALDTVYYGLDGNTDAFSQGWATYADGVAKNTRWLYITVNGLASDVYGTLKVKPVLEANGVVVSNDAITYVNEAPEA